MPDKEPEIAQLIATFREGRSALAERLDLRHAQDFDMAAIHRIFEANRDPADRAQALVLVMMDSGVGEEALQNINDLAAFFCTTEERIEAKIGLGPG